MTWNYTKTWFFLALAAVFLSVVTQTGGQVVGAIFALPVLVGADVASWFRHRKDLTAERE